MGASSSRIWSDICGIQSDDVRARAIETVLLAPEHVASARQSGIYGTVLHWLSSYRRGSDVPFPYDSYGRVRPVAGTQFPTIDISERDTIQHDNGGRWAHLYAPARPQTVSQVESQRRQTEMIVSPAAKAKDAFEQSLELLGIGESEDITPDGLKAAYKRTSLRVHPDKGGTKEEFDAVRKAYLYVIKVMQRISPRFVVSNAEEKFSMAVTPETAAAQRQKSEVKMPEKPPVALSAKKLDMSMFNKLFEENRLPDPERDTGYGDWMGTQDANIDDRLKGKKGLDNFENVYREKAARGEFAIQKYAAPEYLMSNGGTEIGGSTADNFTAAFGSETQFTDLKQAYTTGATVFQEVADYRLNERSARSIKDAQRIREQEMANVDPTEAARFQAAEAAIKERERRQQMRAAQYDVASQEWFDQMRGRLYVTNN
jgi:hypothetical protein